MEQQAMQIVEVAMLNIAEMQIVLVHGGLQTRWLPSAMGRSFFCLPDAGPCYIIYECNSIEPYLGAIEHTGLIHVVPDIEVRC